MIIHQVLKNNMGVVPGYMLKTNSENCGFYFGAKRDTYMYSVSKPQDCDGHLLIVGGAGSGKSSCVVMPTLKTWGGTIIAIDIKGELKKYYDAIESPKRPTKVLNLSELEGEFSGYDPFYLLLKGGTENLVQNARELSQAIIPLPHDARETFWIESGQNILTAAILYYFDIGAGFGETITAILSTSIIDLITKIKNSGNSFAKMHIAQFVSSKDLSDSNMFLSVSATLCKHLIVFATDPQLKKAFTPTADSIEWEDLNTHNIFLSISEHKLKQWGGAVTLILTQIITSLESRPEKFSEEGKELPPILILLDEFPRIGKMDVITNAIATLRSKNVTICLVIQSLAQLDAVYGKDTRRIIADNCQYKAILGAADVDSQRYLSDLIGSAVVTNVSYSANQNSYNLGMMNYSCQLSPTREPIILPHEFGTLGNHIILITPDGYCCIEKTPYYKKPQWRIE